MPRDPPENERGGAEPAGEASEIVEAEEILNAVGDSFPERVLLSASRSKTLPALRIPRHAVIQALAALVKNGLEASPDQAMVELSAAGMNGGIRFVIQDRGCGMSEETLRRVGEPFFTSKEPGKGMGLGVFLTRTLAERLGGTLTFESARESGTRAILQLPGKSAIVHADGEVSSI